MKDIIQKALPANCEMVAEMDPQSLYRNLEQVQDVRKARGKRYPLPLLLTLILLAKLAGETSISGVAAWPRHRAPRVPQPPHPPPRVPTHSTYTSPRAPADTAQFVHGAGPV